MKNAKTPYSSHGKANASGYNYSKMYDAFNDFPTDKQRNYVAILRKTCEDCGLDTKWMLINDKTRSGCNHAIKELRSYLLHNGFDTRGNKVVTYNIKDLEGAENGNK